MAKQTNPKRVETINHDDAKRKNIPTAEYQSVLNKEQAAPVRVAYDRRNRDLDPQLVWRGKDEQDWSELVVQAPPIYIQEKVHPKVLVDDLVKRTAAEAGPGEAQLDLFADFNGIPANADKTDFYQHDQNWTNRMILGDSLQVMASLAEREGLRGKVQCIYLDPPYGIKFNSNFQWSTTSRDVKDGNAAHITREPEQVKAFRDTWRDGIHSYLTYLRDRLTVARDLLTDSGSIFVQIGDENVHRVRAVMDEVFGPDNFVSVITVKKTAVQTDLAISSVADYLIWFCKSHDQIKFRTPFVSKVVGEAGSEQYRWIRHEDGSFSRIQDQETVAPGALCRPDNLTSSHEYSRGREKITYRGESYSPGGRYWSTSPESISRLGKADRLHAGGRTLSYARFLSDFFVMPLLNVWTDTGTGGYGDERLYVVQTTAKVIQRCVLMATDPGDLVLDPTCGSGTTAYVAEQWGRRWITIDTSRVALALARARIMGARYPFYLLADSRDGQYKEAEVTRTVPSSRPVHSNIRHGFVYERVPHITLKSIANNSEIDEIWEKWQQVLDPVRESLNQEHKKSWQEWEIPRYAEDPWPAASATIFTQLQTEQALGVEASPSKVMDLLHTINVRLSRSYTLETLPERPADPWPEPAQQLHAQWWTARIARQKEIDASIAAKAEFEFLYDRPYEDRKTVRVAGPFTVESLSPHRVLGVDENDELIDPRAPKLAEGGMAAEGMPSFVQMVLENLKTAGVQQAHKEDKIRFTELMPWPGDLICAEGRYQEGEGESAKERRAGIFIGPEFGTVTRIDLVEATREASDSGFDVLIACAFNYEAHTTDFNKLGRVNVLKARMNADLHMADDLKNTGKGNLFVVFGEPDIDIVPAGGSEIRVHVKGVDVFHPSTGEVRSDGPDGIACWFIDTDYNQESFFVRHAYFLGANDPYSALKTTLKAEINEEAWATLKSDISRPFERPKSGRIAVKVINHLGDEVMKVFRV